MTEAEVETRVVHCKREPYDVYIGRPSKWGNPYKLAAKATDDERDHCIALYRRYLVQRTDLAQAAVRELRGKRLGCYCAPKRCHGDVLAEFADKFQETIERGK